jgi:K+-transporting ATPase ATPase A chain
MQAFGNIFGWIQLLLFVGLLFALTKPTGLYITQVLDVNGKTRLDFLLGPIERLVYRITGIEAHSEQSWQQYALSLLMFSFLGMLLTYAVLRLQHILPLNPQGFGPVGALWHLTRPSVLQPIPIGKITPENPPCPIFHRW